MIKKQIFLSCLFLINAALLGGCQMGSTAEETQDVVSASSELAVADENTAPEVRMGLFELSGVAIMQEGVLLADDELVGSVYFAPYDASGDLIFSLTKIERKRKDSLPLDKHKRLFPVQDFEGLAADGNKVYLLGSHQAHKSQSRRTDREFLIRAKWEFDEKKQNGELTFKKTYENLLADIASLLTDNGLVVTVTKEEVTPIINIEGLAISNGNLLIGIREPLFNGNAILIKVDAKELFSGTPEYEFFSTPLKGAGIRGLHWDEVNDKLLILSGGKDDNGDKSTEIIPGIWAGSPGAEPVLIHSFTDDELGGPAGQKRAKPEAISRLPDGRIAVYMDGEGAADKRVLYLDPN